MLVHETVARIWGLPAQEVIFQSYKDLSAYGMNTSRYRRVYKKTRFVHVSHVSDTDAHGNLRNGPDQMETAIHELGHSIETSLVYRLLGANQNNVVAEQADFFAQTVSDDWPLKSAAILLALNHREIGASQDRCDTKTQYLRYRGQLRERHVRWLAWETTWLLRTAVTDYNLTHAIATGNPHVLPMAVNAVIDRDLGSLPPFHPLRRLIDIDVCKSGLAQTENAPDPLGAMAAALQQLHRKIYDAPETAGLSAKLPSSLHNRLARDRTGILRSLDILRDNIHAASDIAQGCARWNNYITPACNETQTGAHHKADSSDKTSIRRAAHRHLDI